MQCGEVSLTDVRQIIYDEVENLVTKWIEIFLNILIRLHAIMRQSLIYIKFHIYIHIKKHNLIFHRSKEGKSKFR